MLESAPPCAAVRVPTGRVLLGLVTLALAACAFPVEGEFSGRSPAETPDASRTIVIVYNHGFSRESAGTYKAAIPPILGLAAERNPDVVLFAQVRNTARLERLDHSSFIESAVEHFRTRHRIPVENIILAGQSCGGWGSLQAAAFTYPTVGGVVAFAPTCHGRLPHSTPTQQARQQEIGQLARRARFAGSIFVYQGDSYYDLSDWQGFESLVAARAPHLRVERIDRTRILQLCAQCAGDSHGAVWGRKFGEAFYESHLQLLIARIRDAAVARQAGR